MVLQFLKLNTSSSSNTSRLVLVLSVQKQGVDGMLFDTTEQRVIRNYTVALPANTFNNGTDQLKLNHTLKQAIKDLMLELQIKSGVPVALSIPCTTTKVLELPKMEEEEYCQALVTELERYRAFEHTEVALDFSLIDGASVTTQQRVLVSSCRYDTAFEYLRILKELKLKVIGMYTHPYALITGFLESSLFRSVEQQASIPDFMWGSLMQDGDRFRIFIWRTRTLLDVREVSISAQLLHNVKQGDLILDDLYKEIVRSLQQYEESIPAFWVTHQLNWNTCHFFSEKLATPIQPFEIDVAVQGTNSELNPILLGAYTSYRLNESAYTLNFINKFNSFQVQSGSVSLTEIIQLDVPDLQAFMQGHLRILLTNVLVTSGLCLFLYVSNIHEKKMLNSYEAKKTSTLQDISQLGVELNAYKRKVQFFSSLQLLEKQNSKNIQRFQQFLTLLPSQLPSSSWVDSIQLEETLTLKGYALKYTDILAFTERLNKHQSLADNLKLQQVDQAQSKNNKVIYGFDLMAELITKPTLTAQAKPVSVRTQGSEAVTATPESPEKTARKRSVVSSSSPSNTNSTPADELEGEVISDLES